MSEGKNKAKKWTPLLSETTRIAGRLLRAHRTGFMLFHHAEVAAMVEVITNKIIATHLRQQMGALWDAHGMEILNFDDRSPRKEEIDSALERRLRR